MEDKYSFYCEASQEYCYVSRLKDGAVKTRRLINEIGRLVILLEKHGIATPEESLPLLWSIGKSVDTQTLKIGNMVLLKLGETFIETDGDRYRFVDFETLG